MRKKKIEPEQIALPLEASISTFEQSVRDSVNAISTGIVLNVQTWAKDYEYDDIKVKSDVDADVYWLYLKGEPIASKHVWQTNIVENILGALGEISE